MMVLSVFPLEESELINSKGFALMESSPAMTMSYLGFLQKLNRPAKAIDVMEQVLTSLDKNDSQSELLAQSFNQALEILKIQQ